MARREALTDEPWAIIKTLIPEPRRRAEGRGRPGREARGVLNGVLRMLRRGARWQDWPERLPPDQTCPRRFPPWLRDGTLRQVLVALAEDLRARGALDLGACIDGTCAVANKGGQEWDRPRGAKARRSWRWQPARVFLSPSTWRLLRRTQSP